MENHKVFSLTNGGKTSFYISTGGSCQSITSIEKTFLIEKVEREVTPSVPLGEELYDVVSQYEGIVFGIQSGKQKFHGFGVTINWVKQSIFFWSFLIGIIISFSIIWMSCISKRTCLKIFLTW